MDRITKSLLESFSENNELQNFKETKQFEYFVNFCVISKNYRNSFNLEDVDTGEGGDGAIDGIAIIINGKLVTSIDELNDIVQDSGYLDCDLYVIQSKTSTKFEGASIGSFVFGVKDFISDSPQLVQNDEIKKYHEIWEEIISKSSYMTNRLPKCKLFYVTTGKWVLDKNLEAVRSSGENEIKQTGLFSSVSVDILGAQEIQRLYHETKNKLSTTITFQNRLTLPDIKGVTESYLGMLPFLEFIKLIEDDEGNLYSIFYDNIRDFLGENPVNKKIRKTIEDKDFDLFSLLNNGVTIVAAELTPAGNKFTLRDYQVVNGCQTSHVLHECRNVKGIENLSISVKVIVTKKEDVKNDITIATNSQTEVKPEQLESLTEFQKQLESYYDSIKGDGKLFYERRTQQYHSNNVVKKTQIISIPIQIKTFASIFIAVPHSVSGYYGTIVKRFRGEMFNKNHKYSPYYASSLCYYRLERLFGNGTIDRKYKKIRFHIMMLVRMISIGIKIDPLNSHKLDKKCEGFISSLNNQEECISLFKKAIVIIEKSDLDLSKKQFKAESETLELISTLRKEY